MQPLQQPGHIGCPQAILPSNFRAQQATDQTSLQHLGKSVRGAPVSRAVRAGEVLFVSATPAFDTAGKLATGNFPAQMKQTMDNVTPS
jgi:enamine deaminase RidA (YjgF/YER057c/UK114 family)